MTDLLITLAISDYFSAKFLLEFFIENASYMLVFWFMVIESSFLPFPSEVVVPPAAYLAVTRGDMNIFAIVVVATAGAVVGALINYGLSVWLGRPIVYAFANSRLGHACLIDQTKVENAERYFYRSRLDLYRPTDSSRASAHLDSRRPVEDESRSICDIHRSWSRRMERHSGRAGLLAR